LVTHFQRIEHGKHKTATGPVEKPGKHNLK
jgi:hypothetical protein